MHQTGIAYKQLAPNHKKLSAVTKDYIASLPPIDQVPVTSAVTAPEPISSVRPGSTLNLCGYAYSGSGLAIIRVDVSIDGGETWDQATLERAPESQGIRSGRAWAWVQWRLSTTVPEDATGSFKVVCKAIDDQYNQQPHDPSPIWNLRGILNNSWGNVELKVVSEAGSIEEAVLPFLRASSGDGSIDNVGIKVNGTYQCPDCRQKFDSEDAVSLHWKFIHDPNRQQED
jgi:hypothetical protein